MFSRLLGNVRKEAFWRFAARNRECVWLMKFLNHGFRSVNTASMSRAERSLGEWGPTASSPVKKCTPDAFLRTMKELPMSSASRAGKDEIETDTLIASMIETSLVLRVLISIINNSEPIANARPPFLS